MRFSGFGKNCKFKNMDFVNRRDIHVLKYFSSFVSVSDGRVIFVSDPKISFCPLASHFYKGFCGAKTDKQGLKQAIRNVIELKIREYGFFTANRDLNTREIQVPYGASEMLMFALRRKAIEAAVIVCDGAGTVITDNGEAVQGIGARMNSLLFTSPISNTMRTLKELGCHAVFDNALIDQAKGVEKAIEAGYKKIAVTLSGNNCEKLKEIRRVEAENGVEVTVLVVCTTGVSEGKIEEMRRYADIVWSCASLDIRKIIGACAWLQISKQIPVFVLTKRGADLVSSYAEDSSFLSELSRQKQYLISNENRGRKVRLGVYNCFLREEKLPVFSGENLAMVKS
ncbi:MAG: DUF2099 family protein [Candidatus Omnitrophica bacterium]|nr:DUF2099 family protein [Candidatus Omnitrophota bacterium]MBU1868834.1 DUF2099 family protein [Candidatus Omnitrophota bacterium]